MDYGYLNPDKDATGKADVSNINSFSPSGKVVDSLELPVGLKHDYFKPDFSFLSLKDLEEPIRIYMLGAEKYERDSWQNLPDFKRRYFSALLRHAADYQEGILFDHEFKTLVSAHIFWNALALLHKDIEELIESGGWEAHLEEIERVFKRLQALKQERLANKLKE